MLFHKPPGNDFEVYNDFNSLLVNLYRCVRDKPQELMESLRYVLNAREDFDAVRAALARDSPASDVQKAAWFYQLIRYSYASGLTSFGSQPHDMRSNFPLIEQAHRRLAKVVIENKDFEKLIRQYDRPASLFYLDPPYHATEAFTTLFVDGNHENFDLLNALPEKEWHGGRVHEVRENILHLMRGQIFTFGGLTWFTMGGASSHDIRDGILDPKEPDFEQRYWLLRRMRAMFRVKGVSWWAEEMPNSQEYADALSSLDRMNWKVDCILTHCGPSSIVRKIDPSYGSDQLTDFLDMVNQRCQFTYWFFGHYHDNRIIDDRYILQWEQVSGLEL